MKVAVSYKAQIDDILIKEKRYRDPEFSAGKLAERLGLPAYKLSKVFKAEYGVSYASLVHTHRIQDAVRHLKDHRFTPYTVDDIGTYVGFCNRQSFFHAFKRIMGTTPERFRKLEGGKEDGNSAR